MHGREHRFPDVRDLLGPGSNAAPAADVIFVGDGVYVPEAPEGVERLSVFESVPNAGITAFDVRPLPSDPGRFEAFIEVVRHPVGEDDAGVVVLQIDGAGGASARRTLRPDSGTPLGETVPLTGFVAGPVRAVIAISGEDGLPADDVAHAYIPARNRLRVLLVGGQNPFWEAALRLDPRVSLSVAAAGSDAFADLDAGSLDLVVVEGAPPETMPPVPVLFAGSEGADWLPPRLAGQAASPAGEEGTTVMLPVVRGQTGTPAPPGTSTSRTRWPGTWRRSMRLLSMTGACGRSCSVTPVSDSWRRARGPLRSLAFAFPIAPVQSAAPGGLPPAPLPRAELVDGRGRPAASGWDRPGWRWPPAQSSTPKAGKCRRAAWARRFPSTPANLPSITPPEAGVRSWWRRACSTGAPRT